jgi:hypothetical protein
LAQVRPHLRELGGFGRVVVEMDALVAVDVERGKENAKVALVYSAPRGRAKPRSLGDQGQQREGRNVVSKGRVGRHAAVILGLVVDCNAVAFRHCGGCSCKTLDAKRLPLYIVVQHLRLQMNQLHSVAQLPRYSA